MQDKQAILAKIDEILSDDLMWQPAYQIDENAPAALMQTALENRLGALCWVLGLKVNDARESYKRYSRVSGEGIKA